MNDETTSEQITQLERRVAAMQRQLARRGLLTRWASVAALVAVAIAPVLAWTYEKPHPDFSPGTPIRSSEVNETIDNIYTGLNELEAAHDRVTPFTALDAIGPLPISGSFDSQGGTVLLFASGSAYRSGVGGMVGFDVLVDGDPVGTIRTFTNEPGSHKAIVPKPLIVTDLAAGAHTVELAALPDTASDGNDVFAIVALELAR